MLAKLLIVAAVSLAYTPAVASENRCGWFLNPTPGNLLLLDKDGEWWITSQMQANGPDADGANDKLPRSDSNQYVETQPNGYGYGCACLSVETNAKEKRITRILSGITKPIEQCRSDRSLPNPEM